ncbi:MAG: hypothetical protein IPM56_00275 [Ignavibacteriales bacterium]|nr:MAG: hypothetical protein IPM56_00275 [Ignavibacteriales bacterium]
MKTIYFLALVFLISSCDTSIDVEEQFDYTIEQQMGCFCPQGGVWLKLYVVNDTISKAIRLSDNTILSYDEFKFHKSIKGLFNQIAVTDTSKFDLVVTMDPTNLYPSYLYYNPKPVVNGDTVIIIEDAQQSFTTRKLIKR